MSELCGEWVEPKTEAAIERATRKGGNKDPVLRAKANQERKKRRKRAKAKQKREASGSKAVAGKPCNEKDEDKDEGDDKDEESKSGSEERLVSFIFFGFIFEEHDAKIIKEQGLSFLRNVFKFWGEEDADLSSQPCHS